MTVPMTDDQLQVLIATMRGITDSNQKMNLLRSWAGAELTEQVVESTERTRPKLDIEETREGEVQGCRRTIFK